jgi:hypothetical protein
MGDSGWITIWIGSTPMQIPKESVQLLHGDGNEANDLLIAPSPHRERTYYLFNGAHNATTITEEGIAAIVAAVRARKPRAVKKAAA